METLYRENAKIVYHYLYSRCKDEELSKDLTQETFLKAYESMERFDGSCKISTWLCQIAKHLLYRYWEKAGRQIPTEQMREVMYLRVMSDLSYREIGEIMGKSENWARVTFYRAKEALLKGRDRNE